MAIFMGCVYFYGILLPFSYLLIAVIVMTMIGPEAREVDHIKEHEAEFRGETSSDLSNDKIHDSPGHAEKIPDEGADADLHQNL